LTLVKSAPKKVLPKKVLPKKTSFLGFFNWQNSFWLKLILDAFFTKIKFTFLKLLIPHSQYLKKKSVHLLEGTMNTFENTF
jgi:hypothetical protein